MKFFHAATEMNEENLESHWNNIFHKDKRFTYRRQIDAKVEKNLNLSSASG